MNPCLSEDCSFELKSLLARFCRCLAYAALFLTIFYLGPMLEVKLIVIVFSLPYFYPKNACFLSDNPFKISDHNDSRECEKTARGARSLECWTNAIKAVRKRRSVKKSAYGRALICDWVPLFHDRLPFFSLRAPQCNVDHSQLKWKNGSSPFPACFGHRSEPFSAQLPLRSAQGAHIPAQYVVGLSIAARKCKDAIYWAN